MMLMIDVILIFATNLEANILKMVSKWALNLVIELNLIANLEANLLYVVADYYAMRSYFL